MNVPVVGTEVQLCRRRSADDFINFRSIALLPTLREVVPNVPLLRNGMQLKTRVRGNTRQGVAICDRRIDRDGAPLRPIKKNIQRALFHMNGLTTKAVLGDELAGTEIGGD